MTISDILAGAVVLPLVQVVGFVYDILTLPIYFVIQRPWTKWQRNIWARSVNPADPGSGRVKYVRKKYDILKDVHTLDDMFKLAIDRNKEKICLGTREILALEEELQPDGKKFKKYIMGEYHWLSYNEVDDKVDVYAKGLLNVGIKPKQNVLLYAETSANWMMTAHALFRINAPVVTLYSTLSEEAIIHGITETEVTHIVISQDLIPKIKKIINRIPLVKTIIYFEGFGKMSTTFPAGISLVPLKTVEEKGMAIKEFKREKVYPEDVAIIMYTSGSTGVPKGVMLAHKNIVTTTKGFAEAFSLPKPDDIYMAFLPLAHVFELSTECAMLCYGVPIGYSSPQTLSDRSTGIKRGHKGDATVLRPTVMATVPLVLDRIKKGVAEVVNRKPVLSRRLFKFGCTYKKFWDSKGFKTPIIDAIIFRAIRRTIGGRMRCFLSGSAPLSAETHEFIRLAFSSELMQGYGLTETAAGATAMHHIDPVTGTVGPPLKDIIIKLVDWEEGNYTIQDKPHPRGEVVVGGSSVALGYYKNQALTDSLFKEEDGIRWFYTGDIGEFLPNGNLKIIDRKKDLVKLQMGEYISLGKVESELKTSPAVDNICVYGNGYHNYVVAMIVPNKQYILTLAEEMKKDINIPFKRLCDDLDIAVVIEDRLRQHGLRAGLNKIDLPQKIKLCTEEWLPESGLVTASLKLRRNMIQKFYQASINQMYGIEANGKST